MTRLRLALLGGLDARLDSGGPVVTLARPKVEALLAFLAFRPGQLRRRKDLAALLWADVPGARARQSLRQALAELRRALSPVPGCLIERGDAVGLDPAAVDVDVVAFERLLTGEAPGALEQAVSLYRGDLLEGLRMVEPRFEEWLMGERERLRELAQEALARLLAGYLKVDALGRAVDAALRLVALDPLEESVHRTLMRLYLRLGRRGAGLRQYQLCVDVLRRDLEAAPEAETRQLYLELLQAPAVPDSALGAGLSSTLPLAEGDVVHPAPLLGRVAELTRLRQARDEASRGGRPVVAVLGEAGIGKSRLLAEFVATLTPRDARVLVGRAYETESHLPFSLWVQAFRDGGTLADIASHVERHPVLRPELTRLFPELTDPGGRLPEAAVDYTGLFEAVAHMVMALARPRLLLVLEDLHTADELSLRLLAFVSRRVREGAVMIVLSAREDELADSPGLRQLLAELQREERGQVLRLSPLSQDATIALVGALARSGMEPAALERLGTEIRRVSEGNPFMVVETMRALHEGTTTAALGGLPLPARVRDTVGGRLDRLSDHARRLAGVAATIGRDFDFSVLQQSAGLRPAETAEAVEELVGRRILHAVGERLDFTHEWVRRTAYERLLPPLRRRQHEAIVQALEAQHADRLEEVYDQLAYHASRAGEPARAVRHLRSFAEVASRRYAVEEAIRALREALDHVAGLPLPDQARARITVSLDLAVALSVVGRFEEIQELLAPLAVPVGQLGEPAMVGAYFSRIALTESILGRHARAEDAARRALAEAERCADHASLGTARYVLAAKGFVLGQAPDGVEDARQAVAQFERAGDRAWLAHACWMLGLNHYLLGEFEAAIEAVARMDAIAEALGDRGRQATAAWTKALIELARGELEAARRSAQQALERSPDAANRAAAQAILAMADAEGGETSSAILLLEQAQQQLTRFPQRQATTMVFLGEAYRLAGQLDNARVAARRALETSRGISFAWATAAAQRALGRIALVDGDRDAARHHLGAAFGLFAAIPARFELGRTHLDLAAVARDDTAARLETVEHLQAAHRLFMAARAPRYVERAERLAAELGIGSLSEGPG